MINRFDRMVEETVEEKPFNRCLNCEHIGKRCDGPNFFAMSVPRMGEWARLRKDYLGWTNEHVAQQTGISLTTIARFMSGHMDDLKVTTAQEIFKVLVNGSWGQYPCADPNANKEILPITNPMAIQKISALEKEVESLNCELALRTEEYKKTVQSVKEEAQRKIDYLTADIERKNALLDKKDALIEKLVTK